MTDTDIHTKDTAIQTVSVALGDRAYDILIGTGLIDTLGCHISGSLKQRRVFIVTEETVQSHHGARLQAALDDAIISAQWFVLKPGEATKSFNQFQSLTSDLLAAGIERTDTILAFGGGVIGDLAGFAASTVLRGIDFIQIPTTLLAQVDSSVGGKTGINTPFGKNLIGSFYQPKQVIIDITTLDTLPLRALQAGYAEVVKYGLINDPEFFQWLEENGATMISSNHDTTARTLRIQAISHCCRAKARIVAADERETGQRALLNLGHTFGHALEAECGYDGTLLHGEAVAIGIVMALETSLRIGIAQPESRERVIRHLAKIGMRTSAKTVNNGLDADTLLRHMHKDKKVEAGTIGFILGDIGKAQIVRGVDLEIIRSVLHDSLHTKH